MIVVQRSARQIKRALHVLRGRDLWQSAQIDCERIQLGNRGASWCVRAQGLSSSSIVYSFGVGEDISFDLELIRRFSVCVHAFDPTPRSIAWLSKQALPAKFVFHPYGVADIDGRARFLPPRNPAHVSHTLIERETPWQAIEVPVYRLASILKLLGHQRIDLLKMDIEGAEYSVLSNFLASGIFPQQLLVEFHHRWPEIGARKTKHALSLLNSTGYRIFDVSPSGEEFSFLRMEESGNVRSAKIAARTKL